MVCLVLQTKSLYAFWACFLADGCENRQGNKGRLCEPCGRGESGGDGEQRESIVKQVSSTGGHKSVNGSERWEKKISNLSVGVEKGRSEIVGLVGTLEGRRTLHVCLLTSPPRNKTSARRQAGSPAGICLHLTAAHKPQLQHTHTLHLPTLGQRYRHASLCLPLKKTLGLVMPYCGVIWMLNVDKCMTLSGSVSEYNRRPILVLSCSYRCPGRTQETIVVCPHPNIQQRNTPFGNVGVDLWVTSVRLTHMDWFVWKRHRQ